jgi:hypothetical protein
MRHRKPSAASHPQFLARGVIQASLRNSFDQAQSHPRTRDALNWFQHLGNQYLGQGLLDDRVTTESQEDPEGLTVTDYDAGLPDAPPQGKHLVPDELGWGPAPAQPGLRFCAVGLAERHAEVAFAADDLAGWPIGVLADAGRRKLTSMILGCEQKRALIVHTVAPADKAVQHPVTRRGPGAGAATRRRAKPLEHPAEGPRVERPGLPYLIPDIATPPLFRAQNCPIT